MREPLGLTRSTSLSEALAALEGRSGAFVVDDTGKPVAMLTSEDGIRAVGMGSTDLGQALREDFERT
ncbi:MAG: CBS domain-containing protein, partial [Acidobacteria bacterium]|nr:CBS domain-containing protein [Acidobacteriota bacterium]NIT11795.1 CBS domain-containing protein [Acidobacteriota bacterium]